MGANPYRHLSKEPLGRGSFGLVFKVEDRQTGQVVALKRSLPGVNGQRRIKREIEVQSTLEHDHVMPILDFNPKMTWFTMPLATETLASRFKRRRARNDELAEILHCVAGGLQYAHHRGHIHRDVTPANVLNIGTPEVPRWVVADWGLVQRPLDQESLPLTLTGQGLGTRGFGPPELFATPHGVGPEVDVYYVGALASWALTGEEPSVHYMPVPQKREWADFVTRATRVDPTSRTPSMVEVLSSLHSMRDSFAAENRLIATAQPELFSLTPCGACGQEVVGMRCDNCGAYYATYN